MFSSYISPKVFNIIVQYKRKCTSLSICSYKIYRIFRKLTCFFITPLNLNRKWLNVHWFWLLWVHVYSKFWHIEAEIFFHLKWWSSFTMKSEVSCIIIFNLIKLSEKKTIIQFIGIWSNIQILHWLLKQCCATIPDIYFSPHMRIVEQLWTSYVGDFMYLYMIVLNTKLKMFRFVSLQIHFTDKILKITIHLSILIFVMCRLPVT